VLTTTTTEPTAVPGPGALADARSAVYRFLLAALECPGGDNHGWLAGPEFRRGLALLCDRFDLPVPDGELFPPAAADAQSDYLACFEVGLKGPPVPLLASHYNRREPVPATIHEHVLFYRRFGAGVAAGSPEPPDHLRAELAFLVHLDDLWGSGRIDTLSAARARVDFLSRQLARWVGPALAAATEAGLPPVYIALLGVLRRAVDDDLACCRQILAELDQEAP
jgi:TorA maturation chaperone TorD